MNCLILTKHKRSMTQNPNELIDPFGRKISYVRLSVTDRCDFRCQYCMAEDMVFLPKAELLTLEELARLAKIFIDLGVDKIRLTGGEPLVRRNIISLIQDIGKNIADDRLKELTITTNGSQLEAMAGDLYDAGIRRINVSVDSLNEDKFKAITRRGDLSKVMRGLAAAKQAGLRIKLNMVALKQINDDEILDMVRFCDKHDYDLTFIEVMPMGEMPDGVRFDQYLPLYEVRQRLQQDYSLTPLAHRTGGPARYFELKETGQQIGFITPLTHNFCEGCNRVRITCTGTLYMCLGQDDHKELRDILRHETDEAVRAAIIEAISRKPKGHDFIIDRKKGTSGNQRYMSHTGG